MEWLGEKPDTVFVGQAVAYEGTSMFGTLRDVPMGKRLELPVAEDMQLGMSIGMSLTGLIPISIYPRFNFLLLATNQLVLHLDKLPLYSRYRPKVIIRTAVASRTPLDPQAQHVGNFTDPFRQMLKTVAVIECTSAHQIVEAYKNAYEAEGRSTLIVEHVSRYS